MTKLTAETFANISGIARIAPWNNRTYINLDCGKGWNGDARTKVWFRDMTLTIEMGKGYTSPEFRAALAAVEAAATAAGAKIVTL